jgi:regulator of protease activity HflC (stomatin/prohibitin superfamily)
MGISSVLGALSLIGFLIFLGGIAIVVLSASQGRPVRNGILLALGGVIVGIVFSVISQGILIVQPDEVAVVFNTLNGNLEQPRRSGTSIIVPVIQQVTIYPIRQQQYTMSDTATEGALQGQDAVSARTIDGQEVRLDLTILYGIDPTQVNQVHQRWQDRYEADFVRPTARGIVRDVVSRYRAEDIYGEKRSELEDAIKAQLKARMDEEGLTLTDTLVRDITFSQQFSASIEQAQIAQQEAQRANLIVQQKQYEANQLRAQAAGQRDAAITIAQGAAQATVLQAQAQAEALRLVSQQIAANPMLIQYQYIQTVGPHLNVALIPSNSPFLFDLNSVAANPNFNAPPVPQSTEQFLITPEPLSGTPTPIPGS